MFKLRTYPKNQLQKEVKEHQANSDVLHCICKLIWKIITPQESLLWVSSSVRNHCLTIMSAEISLDAPLQPCWSGSQTMWGDCSLPTLRSHRAGLSCCAALSSTDTLSRHPQLSEKETEAKINSQKRSEIMYRDSSLEIPDFLAIYNLTNRISTQRRFHLQVLFLLDFKSPRWQHVLTPPGPPCQPPLQ